jgi:hypothetical protein
MDSTINGWGQSQRPRSTGGKVSVHDRLGGRVNEESNNRLEEMADSLVPDEDIVVWTSLAHYLGGY